MSIETLLEAAKFLELQAQQQKARGKLVFFFIILYILFQIHPPATYSPKVQHASIQQFRENDFYVLVFRVIITVQLEGTNCTLRMTSKMRPNCVRDYTHTSRLGCSYEEHFCFCFHIRCGAAERVCASAYVTVCMNLTLK